MRSHWLHVSTSNSTQLLACLPSSCSLFVKNRDDKNQPMRKPSLVVLWGTRNVNNEGKILKSLIDFDQKEISLRLNRTCLRLKLKWSFYLPALIHRYVPKRKSELNIYSRWLIWSKLSFVCCKLKVTISFLLVFFFFLLWCFISSRRAMKATYQQFHWNRFFFSPILVN